MRTAHALLIISLLSLTVSAQTFRGTIRGTITDPNTDLVVGAKVTVKNTNTDLERSTTTDNAGNYTVAELPIGAYDVRIEFSGFNPRVVQNVNVEVASERRVDVNLSVATGIDTIVTIATNEQVAAALVVIVPQTISMVPSSSFSETISSMLVIFSIPILSRKRRLETINSVARLVVQ